MICAFTQPRAILFIALIVLLAALALASCGAPAAQPTAPSASSTTAPVAQATTRPSDQATQPAAPQTVEVKYTYDGTGRLTQADYGSIVIKYTYDKVGNLLSRSVVKK